jgi:hypothetical protein
MDIFPILLASLLGVVGAGGYLVLGMYKNGLDWVTEDKKKLLHLVLGAFAAIVGVSLGLPNSFSSILVGWLAPTFLEGIMKGAERVRNGE